MYTHRHRVFADSPWPRDWERFFFFGDLVDPSDLEFDPDTVFAEIFHEYYDEQYIPHIPEDS